MQPFNDSDQFLVVVLRLSWDDSIVKEGSGSAREDEVGETEVDGVLAPVYQGAMGDILHLLPQPAADSQHSLTALVPHNLQVYPLGHDNAVEQTGQTRALLFHKLKYMLRRNPPTPMLSLTICMCLLTQCLRSPSELWCMKCI